MNVPLRTKFLQGELMQYLRATLNLFALFISVGSVLPFVKTDQWWIRVFDFPRLQLVIAGVILLLLYAFVLRDLTLFDKAMIGVMGAAMVIQAWQIFPYTPLSPKQVKWASATDDTVRILVANVLQDNRNSKQLIKEIEEAKPDIILLNETDEWWTEQMRFLERSHPHTLFQPKTNTYGMNFYSRLELVDQEVRFLIDPEIPSIKARLRTKKGRVVQFFGVHPRPPALKRPELDEREDSAQRDAELVVVAKEAAKLRMPVIVAGDFNDVAWSHTTRLFQRTSRLLDPRVGRGLYNSFSARVPFFRYPLDHLFHSDHFTLVKVDRLADFGSDHFPIFVVLNLEPEAVVEQEAPPPKSTDAEEAEKMLRRPAEKAQQ